MRQKQYQQLGSIFLASRKNAILADEMGLGKTNQAVCALDLLSLCEPVDNVLITCPAVVRPQWKTQLSQWLILHNQHPVQQIEKTSDIVSGKTLMVSYNLINSPPIFNQLMLRKYSVGIYDEFQYLKNVEAQRTNNVFGKNGIITRTNHNWFLSGTPVTSKPADLYPVLVTIARKRLFPHTKWLSFIKHYCNAYQDEYNHWQHHGSSNVEELAEKLEGVMLRRLAKDVEPDLGKPLMCEVPLELSKAAQEAYEREADEIESIYESTQQRCILANLKGETIYEHFKVVMTNEQKLIVFYHHKTIGRYLKARIERKTFKIDGSVPVKKRHSIIDEFNKSKFGVMLAQSDAAGTGVDGLQHGCSTCYFAELPWNPDTRDQNIRRLLRPGQKEKVKVIIPVLKNTVDEHIFNGLYRKEKIIKSLLSERN